MKPNDIQPPLLWYEETAQNGWTDGWAVYAEINPERHEPGCHVYWGSHGCCRPHGHEGAHWCDCCHCDNHPDPDSGCVAGPPYYGPATHFYGEETP